MMQLAHLETVARSVVDEHHSRAIEEFVSIISNLPQHVKRRISERVAAHAGALMSSSECVEWLSASAIHKAPTAAANVLATPTVCSLEHSSPTSPLVLVLRPLLFRSIPRYCAQSTRAVNGTLSQ